ncbi:MAG: heavy-metal-associated domain-containing protein [Deltaproteobacteria bacterium]|nr:heavy-metal-associated domain-containing protein [Deltaproteobacteria bacterium]
MKTIKINGMSCQHCVMAVKKALSGIDGIENVTVDLATGTATFEGKGSVDRETIRHHIEEAGYELVEG